MMYETCGRTIVHRNSDGSIASAAPCARKAGHKFQCYDRDTLDKRNADNWKWKKTVSKPVFVFTGEPHSVWAMLNDIGTDYYQVYLKAWDTGMVSVGIDQGRAAAFGIDPDEPSLGIERFEGRYGLTGGEPDE